jgi:hypothetical protein
MWYFLCVSEVFFRYPIVTNIHRLCFQTQVTNDTPPGTKIITIKKRASYVSCFWKRTEQGLGSISDKWPTNVPRWPLLRPISSGLCEGTKKSWDKIRCGKMTPADVSTQGCGQECYKSILPLCPFFQWESGQLSSRRLQRGLLPRPALFPLHMYICQWDIV